jgi:YVTN family beta-propeller protein
MIACRRIIDRASTLVVLVALAACGNDTGNRSGSSPSTLSKVVMTALPTGQLMSPTATPGAIYKPLYAKLADGPDLPAGFAQSTVLSPDGKTLVVLTSGFNRVVDSHGKKLPNPSTQFAFIFDVSAGVPIQKQVLQISNTYVGISFSPDGKTLYVPGAGEDNLHVIFLKDDQWVEDGAPIKLGHTVANGLDTKPMATGVAITADGRRALVVNRYNDSLSIVDLVTRTVLAEQDLRPGKSGGIAGTPGGEDPNSVAIVGNRTAYVSSERDREIVVVDIASAKPSVVARISVPGNPNKLVINRANDTLYVASDNADVVSIIDLGANLVRATIRTIAPRSLLSEAQARYKGASPSGLTLSPDEKTLYVTNRGSNSLAVISLSSNSVTGLIPTGWYPSDVRVSANGRMLYISNAKTLPGPNPGNCQGYQKSPCPVPNSPVQLAYNQYIENLTGSALLSLPVPNAALLDSLTQQVARNNNFNSVPGPVELKTMAMLRANIKHVIYVVKENRTYDQVLGDLGKGNGAPGLTEFPWATTPNQHMLAKQFVTLDNFHDTGEVSGNGWPWSIAARESDAGARMLAPNYAGNGGGGSYDWEDTNRNVNVGLTGSQRIVANPQVRNLDVDTLPGTGNVAAPDGPNGEQQQGYLWNAALRAGLSVRNYGFFVDGTRYTLDNKPDAALLIPRDRAPFANKIVQAYAADPALVAVTDPYFRGFDNAYPDFYRMQEWEREFNNYVRDGDLPNLSLVRFMNDHTGSFKAAIDGVNAPDIQVADNDYAVGRLVEAVAKSRYAGSTLIFIVEDDAQDGPDHVDAHRSTAFVVGPYVKQGAVVSVNYSTVSMLRTITDILGLDHLGTFDANVSPMTEVFDPAQSTWTFAATASGLLKGTKLPLPANQPFFSAVKPAKAANYWIALSKNFDFSSEDKVDAVAYNKVLWQGLMGAKPYPQPRAAASASRDGRSVGD